MGIVSSITLAYVIKRIFTCPEGKLFALKEVFAQVYFRLRRLCRDRRLDTYNPFEENNPQRVALLHPDQEVHLENRRNTENVCDAILIYGANSNGDKLLIQLQVVGDQSTAALYLYINQTQKEYVLPQEVVYRTPKSGPECFVAGGLRVRCLSPMRIWRISFNGLLKESGSDFSNDHHVKFSFIWTAGTDVFDASTDIHADLLARFFAQCSWNDWAPDFGKLTPYVDSYEQCGNLGGTVAIDGSSEQEINLWGFRIRKMVPRDSGCVESSSHFFGYTTHGDSFHVECIKFAGIPNELRFGFFVHCSSFGGQINSLEMQTKNDKMEFTRGSHKYTVETVKCSQVLETSVSFHGNKTSFQFCSILLNGEEGIGLKCNSALNSSPLQTVKALTSTPSADHNLPILCLSDWRCKDTNVTGGKAASLATLTQLNLDNEKFVVPRGVVMTVTSYKEFIDSSALSEPLKHLEKSVWGNDKCNVQELCQSFVGRISSCIFPSNLKSLLHKKLADVFGAEYENCRFAVRSSALGEDSEELSAAGQMETYLGVQGTDKVMKAVVKCWASQFSYTAVQYKRQNGQILNSAMAVVIQEMVPAEIAGVMFTCDPLDGNPGKINIAANYGIGESVVSATAEPDSVVLERTSSGQVTYMSGSIGKKQIKVVMKESQGVSEENCSEEETRKCCISPELAVQLGKIGLAVEMEYGCPMDIEWAAKDGQIYVLQARPITTFDIETDFEIAHEFDSAIRCDEDYHSKANLGEVMPGAMSVLGTEVCLQTITIATKRLWLKRNPKASSRHPYKMNYIGVSQHHVLFAILDTVLKEYNGDPSVIVNAYCVAFFGRILDDKEMLDVAARRHRGYPPDSIFMLFYIMKDVFRSESKLNTQIEYRGKYEIDIHPDDDAKTVFMKIVNDIPSISKVMSVHAQCTVASSFLNVIILGVLASANRGWDEKVYEDFARILSTCDEVESADVPSAVQNLACLIQEDNPNFKDMPMEDALTWLKTSGSNSSNEFDTFINKHGHRCVKEFDVYTKPWGEDTLPFVKTLQEMVGNVTPMKNERSMDINESFEMCNIKLNATRRMILRLVIPRIRKMVGLREKSKSLFMKQIDSCRKGLRILASKLVSEGRLPDCDLLYFLSINEIDHLLKTRSPKPIQKAFRRRSMHPKLDQLRFPETIKGIPRPIPDGKTYIPDGDLILKGTPVSRGVVQARARVARNLNEVTEIQNGEVLIAYSTDIGWSPYFPLLAGVATELGGLVSHGAVVAREYGLPCVVSVHGATDLFKTGDLVILNGNKGWLTRVS